MTIREKLLMLPLEQMGRKTRLLSGEWSIAFYRVTTFALGLWTAWGEGKLVKLRRRCYVSSVLKPNQIKSMKSAPWTRERLLKGRVPSLGINRRARVRALSLAPFSLDLVARVYSHNRSDKTLGEFTRKNGRWKLVWSEQRLTCSEAMIRESLVPVIDKDLQAAVTSLDLLKGLYKSKTDKKE